MLKWEHIKNEGLSEGDDIYRSKVPGGWMVLIVMGEPVGMTSALAPHGGISMTFYPDPSHFWDGSSI